MRVAAVGEPGLQQRRVGRDGEERHADAEGQDAEQPEIGLSRPRLGAGGQSDRKS